MSVGDVADRDAMVSLAETAVRELGGFDTWINNAGVSIYGRIEDVPVDDARRLFETNYWGVVHGSLAALPHLRRSGGALINLGSILSDTGYPLQGHYTASKHAVKGFTDSLRLELEHDEAPVSVTLIQPAVIDTPLRRARPHVPRRAAEAHAAGLRAGDRGRRDLHTAPSTRSGTCWWAAVRRCYRRSRRWRPAPRPGDARERGRCPGRVMKSSVYTRARRHREKLLVGLAVAGAGYVLARQAGRGRR